MALSHHTPDNILLGLDIGTDYVKAVIVRREDDDSLSILGVGRAKQSSGSMRAGTIIDIPSVSDTCEKAVHEAEEMGGVTARLTVVGIAGELVKCATSSIRYNREQPKKPLSDSEMSVILEKVQTASGERAQKEIAFETDNPRAEVSLINSAVISITIDGQKVNNPIGFNGSEVILQFYTAFAPVVHTSAIERVCSDLQLELLSIAVDPFAICRACLGNREDVSASIILDIGGGNTSIAIIDSEGIKGTDTFSIGARSIERDINVWVSGVQIALSEFPHVESFPCRILLCGGGADMFEVQETLATTDWFTKLPFPRRPSVDLIDTESLPDLKNPANIKLDSSFITAIGLTRVAVDALDSEQKPSLVSKISNLLKN